MYRNPNDRPPGAGAEPYYLPGSSTSPSLGQSAFPSPLYFESSFNESPQNLQPPQARLSPPTSPSSRRTGDATDECSGFGNPPRGSAQHHGHGAEGSGPDDRTLPSKEVIAETFTDAYVSFILYCNPQFGPDTDTTTLRTNFQRPPRSDERDFETWNLWLLIRKFDVKEIKTWGQLALDLGVHPPDTTKGQSVQKVQQYTVRLKRWMRAMHIDAFFEFLLGKQHVYFTDIPPASDPNPAGGRDGVHAEEDLAIRALDPAWRPKRGRKRNFDVEQEGGDANSDAGDLKSTAGAGSRIEADASQGHADSAFPHSAHPTRYGSDPWAVASAVTPQTFAPHWGRGNAAPQTAVATTAPSHLRWQLHGSGRSTGTPHPFTAYEGQSMNAHIEAAFENEPQSAITPARKRRRHGPAVSSAWPSVSAPGSKPRGRPPASRNVQDGPFGTFPSRPSVERSPKLSVKEHVAPANEGQFSSKDVQASSNPASTSATEGESSGALSTRPQRLSLQVPQITGRPVRLATPPTVLITPEADTVENLDISRAKTASGLPVTPRSMQPPALPTHHPTDHTQPPGFDFETLKRVLTSDLLRAELTGRPKRLSGDEAKNLADAVLRRLGVPRTPTAEDDGDSSSRDTIARLTAASWLGIGSHVDAPRGSAISSGKRIAVTYYRTNADGYEEPVSARDLAADSTSGQAHEVFDVSWKATQGACTGTFEIKDVVLGAQKNPDEPLLPPLRPDVEPDGHDRILDVITAFAQGPHSELDRWIMHAMADAARRNGARASGDERVDWKQRCMSLEFGMKVARGEVERNKKRLLEKVLGVLLEATD